MRLAGTALLLSFLHAAPLLAAEGGELPRIVNFTIVVIVLAVVLRKPIAGYLNAKTEQIREELKDAREKEARATEERKEAEALLASLDDEVEKAKQEARRAAQAESARIVKAAEGEAQRIRDIAQKQIETEVEAGRRKLLTRATELSVSLARKKLEETITDEDQARILDESIAIMGKTK